jgi:hypothetical protein
VKDIRLFFGTVQIRLGDSSRQGKNKNKVVTFRFVVFCDCLCDLLARMGVIGKIKMLERKKQKDMQ